MSQTRTTAIVMAKWTEESSYTKNHMQLENQRVEEIVFPAEGESGQSMGKGKIIIKMYYI